MTVSLLSPDEIQEEKFSVPLHHKYVLISPAYNEERFIARMIETIASQTVLPGHWVIVDDGSTDGTQEIIKLYAQRYPFIERICLPTRRTRKPGGEGAVQQALAVARSYSYDFLARFDADLEFNSDYIARILDEFSRDEKLGIAGGGLYLKAETGRFKLEKVPRYHVRGALKMYRRECLEEIGELCTYMGWDTIDEVYAWKHGWRTRSFSENRVIHRRPTGDGLSKIEIARKRGHGEYYTWSHPLFVLAKAIRVAFASPTSGFYFLRGFLECYRKHEDRLQDSDFKRIRRKQQLRRIISLGILSEPKL
jgi:biofilm PGA synthesis N-glycosyltransferase PgaC